MPNTIVPMRAFILALGTAPRTRLRALAIAVLVASLVAGLGTAIAPAAQAATWKSQAKKVKASAWPARVAKVTAGPGSAPGTAIVKWKASNETTSYYQLDLASTMFSKSDKTLPTRGRDFHSIKIPRNARSYTVSAALAAKVGAPIGSGNHIFFRFYAVNSAGKKNIVRVYPGLHAFTTAPPATGGTTDLTVASYNVGSIKAAVKTKGATPWSSRRAKVASIIASSGAGLVALQEVGPGNIVDGGAVKSTGLPRHTDDLVAALADKVGSDKYRLVRTTPYVQAGKTSGSQGARILYDSTQYKLLSNCPEETGKNAYSPSCSFPLPLNSGDSEGYRRRAAYALFEQISTGKVFYFVSVHLEHREGTTSKSILKLDKLRGKQATAVVSTMKSINTSGYPVIIGGDLNSWQNYQRTGALPQTKFLKGGYIDGASATKRVGVKYPTSSQWATTVKASTVGFGSRIDYLLAKGVAGATRYTNTMVRKDSRRGSDHALIKVTFRLP
ncbi:endonuclease/exonuclease/phosphatase family metal-dependent hydrolase [Rarobacter faecitabidus]|uniref:Endonuclease/exonuclease/phosphatase family metal-dependent hydrolase n=2 Tax=Rarobacter faecitabidus TaxID=13243 RepID=A0A542ZP12_RARFA|nr:endonuclease/exonuclease/phosphatase family metal-dependent hydrolase [Rarobacter faecitabidus]